MRAGQSPLLRGYLGKGLRWAHSRGKLRYFVNTVVVSAGYIMDLSHRGKQLGRYTTQYVATTYEKCDSESPL
jgi:hypothetical protein